MRFELTIALKYLIPRWRQLSVSIISLISVLVISLVVWLVIIFLSVTEGIEKKWVRELVALVAPIKLKPSDAYYHSYYYQIDALSFASNFSHKTIGEKLTTTNVDPYNASLDAELPLTFPTPDRREGGELIDPVKEAWAALSELKEKELFPREYEISFGNLHLYSEKDNLQEKQKTHLNQVSYIAPFDTENHLLANAILPLTSTDYNNLLISLSKEEAFPHLLHFFKQVNITQLQTSEHFSLISSILPAQGIWKGVGIVSNKQILKVFIPKKVDEISSLENRLANYGLTTTPVQVQFAANQPPHFQFSDDLSAEQPALFLDAQIPLKAQLLEDSLAKATSFAELLFEISTSVQEIAIKGRVPFDGLEIAEATTRAAATPELWMYKIGKKCIDVPCNTPLGEGILVAKHFQSNGVQIGDRGYLAYYTPTAGASPEQRISVYVAGFYDPGVMPIGNKLIFVNPKVIPFFRSPFVPSDSFFGNGVNLWFSDLSRTPIIKENLQALLKEKGVDKYWTIETYEDYELTRPILQQLKSDKTLFTLIALIILTVACSNIISMLILLVNDKRREIGVLHSMGASPSRIAAIFGICGFTTGVLSCFLGTIAALVTLHYLQNIINFLSFLQGHEVFQAAFYGSRLPNEVSFSALTFVIIATLFISLIAGLIPAWKATRIRTTDIVRAE